MGRRGRAPSPGEPREIDRGGGGARPRPQARPPSAFGAGLGERISCRLGRRRAAADLGDSWCPGEPQGESLL